MKKILSMLAMLFSMVILFNNIAFTAEMTQPQTLTMQIGNPVMTINNIEKEIDQGRGTTPIIVNNRTLVPIRAIVEELGGTVDWNQADETATLNYAENEIRLKIDNTTAYFNDEEYTLDVAPTTINGRTMLPIRFIAEHFQFAVDWNQETQSITVTKNQTETISSTENATEPEPNDAEEAEPKEAEVAKEANPKEEPTQANKSRAVVVYFSATGNTKSLAEKVSETANADLQEIVPEVLYTSADLNYNDDNCRANKEIHSNVQPPIQPLANDIAEYDIILLGYPIWWGKCPPAVQTFLDTYDLSGKTIMPFCTSGSSGISGSLSQITQLCPNSNLTKGFRGTSATTNTEINTWLDDNNFTAE